jgi:hypothetical protein
VNTANLQLEGVYVLLSALVATLRDKGALTQAEIADLLDGAEARINNDLQRERPAHADAVLFPVRYLREALDRGVGEQQPGFTAIAAAVGATKPQR